MKLHTQVSATIHTLYSILRFVCCLSDVNHEEFHFLNLVPITRT